MRRQQQKRLTKKTSKDFDLSPPEPAAVVPKDPPTKAGAFDLKRVLASLPAAALPREDPGSKKSYCVPIRETKVQVLLERCAYYIVDPPERRFTRIHEEQ